MQWIFIDVFFYNAGEVLKWFATMVVLVECLEVEEVTRV